MNETTEKRLVSVKMTTEEMYLNWLATFGDQFWVDGISNYDNNVRTFNKGMRALLTDNMPEIRQLFIDSWTVMLMGKKMELIDHAYPPDTPEADEHEIRVYSENKLIGVIIDSEIDF